MLRRRFGDGIVRSRCICSIICMRRTIALDILDRDVNCKWGTRSNILGLGMALTARVDRGL
jgi:hypothetical protein